MRGEDGRDGGGGASPEGWETLAGGETPGHSTRTGCAPEGAREEGGGGSRATSMRWRPFSL